MYYSIIYQSKAAETLTFKDVEMMLMKAKRKNKKLGITGCIVYANNKFVQLIQGPKPAIENLYKRIKTDKRHIAVTTLLKGSTEEKIWSEWSMALLNFSGTSSQIMSSRVLLESYFESAEEKEKDSEVFKTFREHVHVLLNDPIVES